MKNIIIRSALATGLLLLIPLGLQLTIGTGVNGQGFNWTLSDFVVMGGLVFVTSFLIGLAARKLGRYRIIGVVVILFLFVWLWAELAVGVFTNWGS
ncbi:MAG: hypothetical protein WDZ79_02365 [Candidatus Paceibacterota bacterium]